LNEVDKRELINLNKLLEKHKKTYKRLDELIINNDMKLEDLKIMIQSLLSDRSDNVLSKGAEFIRLRCLTKSNTNNNSDQVNFQQKNVLFEWNKSLKQLHLCQELDLSVELLDEDEIEEEGVINQGIVLLNSVQILIDSETNSDCDVYLNSFKQLKWNVNNGASLISLKESIIKTYNLEPSAQYKMTIAKKNIDKCQWILLKDIENKQINNVNIFFKFVSIIFKFNSKFLKSAYKQFK
jgi:hypothetical protein